MKKLLLFKKMIIVILLAGMSLAGWAQVILYEPFNYATPAYIGGNTDVPGIVQNNWATHSISATQTTTIDIQDGSLTYAGLEASTGNKVYLFSNKNTVSRDINRAFTSTAKVMYFSALINLVDTMQIKSFGDYFMHFGGTSGSAVGSPNVGARLGVVPASSATTFKLTIQNNSGGTPSFTVYGTELNIGTTYLVVVKLDLSAAVSVATLWVNPATLGGAEPAGSISNNTGTNTFTSFASICLRNGSSTPKVNIDEIRVGTTFASVTPLESNVGISKRDQASRQTSIYPNPAKSSLNVKAPAGDYVVSINNTVGSLVKSIDLNSSGRIELSDLRPGIYYVTVQNVNTNLKEVHKLIVR